MSKHPRCNARHAIELHLSGDIDLPRRYGGEIRAMGGHYTECRGGMAHERFVTLPLTEDGTHLATELIGAYGGSRRAFMSQKDINRGSTCVVARTPAIRDAHIAYLTSGEAIEKLSVWREIADRYDVAQEESRCAIRQETTRKLRSRAAETADEAACLARLAACVQDRDEAAYLRLCERANKARDAAAAELAAYPVED